MLVVQFVRVDKTVEIDPRAECSDRLCSAHQGVIRTMEEFMDKNGIKRI